MHAVQVWRAAEVADLYGVDESTVHRWERAGRLRRARRDPGGGKYWLPEELLADVTAAPDDGRRPAVFAVLAAQHRGEDVGCCLGAGDCDAVFGCAGAVEPGVLAGVVWAEVGQVLGGAGSVWSGMSVPACALAVLPVQSTS